MDECIITILGCGSSGGVPRVGSGWGACDPGHPRNRRRRCSLLVERVGSSGITRVLIDTSPDLREQLLGQNVMHLDAVLLTHEHADHTHGIDDLRPLVIHNRKRLPFYMDAATSVLMRARFGYCFETPLGSDYPPILDEYRLTPNEPVTISGAGGALSFIPFEMIHGSIRALGFRFEGCVYAPDVSLIPPESLQYFEDLELLILDALRYTPHPTHFSLSEALDVIAKVKPSQAILTNLHSDMDYETLRQRLSTPIEPAYDGLTCRFSIRLS